MKKPKRDPNAVLSTAYQKFEALFPKLESIPVEEWTITHCVIYICKEYEKKFKIPFTLSYKDSPSSCSEYKLTARIFMMLGVKKGQAQAVKDYIDWFYKNYNGKNRFISIGALAKEERISEYKKQKIRAEKPNRTTILPEKYIEVISFFPDISYIKTWGDLAFLKQATENDPASNGKYVKLFEILEVQGLNLKLLREVV
jgi:hypothetical protein